MDERGMGSSSGKQQTTEHTSRRMLRVAAALLIFSFLLFLVQLLNLNLFDVKASGMDSLPVSIRAGAQADYSGDPPDLAVPPISENILQQIINDIPATGSAQDRMGRSEEHTSELQSQSNLVCRLLLEKKNKK